MYVHCGIVNVNNAVRFSSPPLMSEVLNWPSSKIQLSQL